MASRPLVVLFGYEASAFTQKIRFALKLKGIKYTYVTVPSMMPRPILHENFNLTYRKIPVLTIERDLFVDTSHITEALEHHFPSPQYRSLYPKAADGRSYRSLIRGFASYWTDRPLFRVTCGLMPASIWRSHFGKDREELIGHALDPDKLEKKIPQNLSLLDMQLSMFEPLLLEAQPWIFSGATPSLADIALYYQLRWGRTIAEGEGTENLTAGEAPDTPTQGARSVFNTQRYPATEAWFERVKQYLDKLPSVETKVDSPEETLQAIRDSGVASSAFLPTHAETHSELDKINGLVKGAAVSVVPDDTGRQNPTFGYLLDLTPEEIIIEPQKRVSENAIPVRIHFPKVGFVVRPTKTSKI